MNLTLLFVHYFLCRRAQFKKETRLPVSTVNFIIWLSIRTIAFSDFTLFSFGSRIESIFWTCIISPFVFFLISLIRSFSYFEILSFSVWCVCIDITSKSLHDPKLLLIWSHSFTDPSDSSATSLDCWDPHILTPILISFFTILTTILKSFSHRGTLFQVSLIEYSSTSVAWLCFHVGIFAIVLSFICFPFVILILCCSWRIPYCHRRFLFYSHSRILVVAAAFVFWNAIVVNLLCSNLIALFRTSSGSRVSNVNVSCNFIFFIFERNRSRTISFFNVSNSDRAACAVSAAWNASSDSPVSCIRVNNLYLSYVTHFTFWNETSASSVISLNNILDISTCWFFCRNRFFPSVPNDRNNLDTSFFCVSL